MKKFWLVLFLLLIVGGGVFVYFRLSDTVTKITLEESFVDEYYYGDSLDITGGKIKVKNIFGSEKIVEVEEEMISEFSTEIAAGSHEMKLTYKGKSISISYLVKELEIYGVDSVKGLKEVYSYGEKISLESISDIKVVVNTNRGLKEFGIYMGNIEGFDTDSIGEKTMTINYKSYSYSFEYEVKAITQIVSLIGVEEEYFKGVSYSLFGNNGIKAECIAHDGSTVIVKVSEEMLTGFDVSTTGSKTMTITITGVSYQHNYIVKIDTVVEILSIEGFPKNLILGQPIPYDDVTVTYLFASGKIKSDNLSEDMVLINTQIEGKNQHATVRLDAASAEINYNIYDIDDVVGNGLYYDYIGHSLGDYVYILVEGNPTKTSCRFRIFFSDTKPERIIKEKNLLGKGIELKGTRSVEEGYILYSGNDFSISVFREALINLNFSSETDNVAFIRSLVFQGIY